MKKYLLIFVLFLFFININSAYGANYKINSVNDGTVLKCTGKKQSGSINEYDKDTVDYYTFKDGKIYSKNMVNLFLNGKGDERKVKKLKINDDQITFRDELYQPFVANYKYVTIDRKTGAYNFEAKREYSGSYHYKKAIVTGQCSVVKNGK